LNQREIPNYWPGNCFGCSPKNKLGLKLRFWSSEYGCFTRCKIPDYMCGFERIVHGGIISLLLDEAAEWVLIVHLNRLGVTRNMSVHYIGPVQTNTEILVESHVASHDKRSAVLKSYIRSVDGSLLAKSESKWAFPKLSIIAKMTGISEASLQEFLAKYLRLDNEPHRG